MPPIRLTSSLRLENGARRQSLSPAQDVIALALENNLDIAVALRPFLSREVLKRAEAGGLLRGTTPAGVAGPSSVSTAGVSAASSGLAGGAGIGSVGAVITGIGPNLPVSIRK